MLRFHKRVLLGLMAVGMSGSLGGAAFAAPTITYVVQQAEVTDDRGHDENRRAAQNKCWDHFERSGGLYTGSICDATHTFSESQGAYGESDRFEINVRARITSVRYVKVSDKGSYIDVDFRYDIGGTYSTCSVGSSNCGRTGFTRDNLDGSWRLVKK